MLKYYVRRGIGEEFEKVSQPPKENAWIHGDIVTEHELRFLAHEYNLEANILHDVLDTHELPRVEMVQGGGLYVFVRSARRGKHGRLITTPVLLATKGSVFVNLSVGEAQEHSEFVRGSSLKVSHPTGLMLATFASIVSGYEELLQRTARYIHDTAQRLRTHEVTNQDFIRFATVEDNLNDHRRNLNGMLVVTKRLKEVLNDDASTLEAIEDIVLHIKQLLVAVDSYGQNVTSIQNAYRTIGNNNLNQRITVLTVLTLLVAIPNLFYGMYGMNIALPFQDQPWAYPLIISFTVFVIVLVVVLAKWKKIF